ncbi:MAG: sterol desaturase family protein [Nannocystaceae bacterium]|nr:sterol desaturase family protein [Nannocystaceae bacterium]
MYKRQFILPAMVAGIGAATWALLNQTPLPRPAASSLPLAACALLIWALEFRFPAHAAWFRKPDLKDVVLLVVNRLVDAGVLASMVILMSMVTAKSPVTLPWPTHWPVVLQVVLGLLLAETLRYAIHRLSHREGFWWRIHTTHHEPNRMYLLNGPRLHPLNYLWVAGAHGVPMLALGASLDVVLVVVNVTALFVVFQHANVKLRFGGLNKVFATPDVHRLHHARDMPAGGVNYAIVLLVVDRIFGTYAPARPVEANGIGLAKKER